MTKKKKKELKPEYTDNTLEVSKKYQEEMLEIGKDLQNSEEIQHIGGDNSDNFFRNVINNLMDKKNISTKTEYISINENLSGTKLQFLGDHVGMSFFDDFIKIFETKRVSLLRKGRKELILAMEKRDEDLKYRQQAGLRGIFGL